MGSIKGHILRPYYLWVGEFSQNGSNPPVFENVIYNTFPKNINITGSTYNGEGLYVIDIQTSFTNDLIETSASIQEQISLGSLEISSAFRDNSFTQLFVEVFDVFFFANTNSVNKFTITIKQYY